MRASDLADVAAMEASVFSMPWNEKGFADAIAQPDNLFLAAELENGEIGAYCGMYTAAGEGEITNVAVRQDLRRQGLGREMISHLLRIADERGIGQIFLEVRVSNTAARRLYENAGFSDCGVRRDFYRKPKEDALVMCVKLPVTSTVKISNGAV